MRFEEKSGELFPNLLVSISSVVLCRVGVEMASYKNKKSDSQFSCLSVWSLLL